MNRLVGNLDNQLIIQLICQAKILTILCFLASQMRNCFFSRVAKSAYYEQLWLTNIGNR